MATATTLLHGSMPSATLAKRKSTHSHRVAVVAVMKRRVAVVVATKAVAVAIKVRMAAATVGAIRVVMAIRMAGLLQP